MEQTIKELFKELGADLCGIAHVERFAEAPHGFHPCNLYNDCKSVVMFAKRLPRGAAQVSPRLLYNHANTLTKNEVDRIAYEAALLLETRLGCTVVPLPCDSPYEYWETDTLTGKGLLSMRHAAALAGLGTLGKSKLLINRQYGSFITLGGVLTNLELQSDPLAEEVCLPGCNLCRKNCPTQALNGESVNQTLCRPHTYGTNGRGFDVVHCNTCRTICPRALGVKQ